MKLKGQYKLIINRFDKRKEQLRKSNEKEIRQFVKQRAMSVGLDMINTQHSLSSNIEYRKELKHRKFQSFQDFMIYIADQHRIDFYFEIENGKFRWF